VKKGCATRGEHADAAAAGDVMSARVAYKNAVANELVYKSPEIWEYFLEFEAEYGTVLEMLAVESQRLAALGERAGSPRDILLTQQTRYTTMGLWPCTKEQRRYIEGLQGRGVHKDDAPNTCAPTPVCCTPVMLL
jgi:hypothetical protein